MNLQEGMQVSGPTSTISSPAPTTPTMSRIMPVLYVNKSVSSANTVSSTGVPASSSTSILTAVPQIQLAGGGNPQIIHSTQNSNTYQYVPMRQSGLVYQPKNIKDNSLTKKVFVTSINSGPNTKSNQVNLVLPNSQPNNQVNKSPIASLILPNLGAVSNKITGMLVPNNSGGLSSNKQTVTSLLLPTNSKYPNIAPNKKIPIPNILIPQQNVTNKGSNVPNIIRQGNNSTGKNVMGIISSPNPANSQMTSLLLTQQSTMTNANNKQPPTSVGLSIPTSVGSHGLMVPQSTAGAPHSILVSQSMGTQSHDSQQHKIIVSQSCNNSLIVAPSTTQPQLMNYILTPTTTLNQSLSTIMSSSPAASLLISNNSSSGSSLGSSLLVSQSSPLTSVNNACQTTSILMPVSVASNKGATLVQSLSYSNAKKSMDKSLMARDNKQSVLVKPGEANYPSLPPLQPISVKENLNKSVLVKPPNGLNVPECLIMTPVTDGETIKARHDKISEDMTIERSPAVSVSISTDEKGTSTTNTVLRMDERARKSNDDNRKSDMGTSITAIPPLRRNDKDEGLVLDGDVTMRRLGPEKKKEDLPVKKQVDDDVNIEIVKPVQQKLPPPRYQKPEDLDPFDVLEWDHKGVGKLPGSNIKFRLGEYGLDLVVDNKEESSSVTPGSSRRNSDDKPKSPKEEDKDELSDGPEKIYCCEGCGCYGLYNEFLMDTRFCSVGCKKIVLARNEMKKKRQEDKMREMKLRRKRRRIKILSQRAKKGCFESTALLKEMGEMLDEADPVKSEAKPDPTTTKVCPNKTADGRKSRKPSTEASVKLTMSDEESTANMSDDQENSENVSRSSPGPSVHSEDDASSDKTGPTDIKDMNFLNSTGEFLWTNYLHKACNKAKAAPVKLFKDPFPYGKNCFKVGMKLEGIDPEHQAIISVFTVAQLKGHRIRLHFDGFPEVHDFWANTDSPDIFPPGWCERNNHTLDPPRGYTAENFSWNTYLKQCRASPAPKSLFPKANTPLCPSQFRVGMKLEAVDRKNSSLICVASVTNIIDHRLLIHFDSWGDVYDYWADPTSPYIHPVGWCEQNGYDLTPPNNFKTPSAFNWDTYLKDTRSVAAPARAFKPRAPTAFKRGMRVEAIDRRSPSYLRPATIKEVKDYQIKIVFDAYPEEFGYWVDDDCPDIHPCGWGHKTGHQVTPPPLAEVKSECGTEGCTGDGNIKGGFLVKHTTPATCPYSPQNLDRDLPDRFCINPDFYEVPEPINKSNKSTSTKTEAAEDSSCSESRIKTRFSSGSQKEDTKEEPKEKKTEPEEKVEERVERRGRKRKLPDEECRKEQLDRLRKELIQTVFDPGYKPAPEEQEMWVKHVATLGHKVNVTGGDPRSWNHKQVAAFVNTVIPSRAKLFLDQEIDGDSFLQLTQVDLTRVLGLKLGPALKIYNCIILLRQKALSL